MGLKVPSTMQFPQDVINGIRDLNGSGPHSPVATASSTAAPPTSVDAR
jgi:hypothetical protein